VRSRRPFDYDGLEIAGSVWGVHTAEAGAVTPNGNILISDRWDTGIGEIGVLANASFTKLTYLDTQPSNTDFIADPEINGQRVRLPDIARLNYNSGTRWRPSVNVAAQWRPNSSLEFYIEGLYQGFRHQISDRNFEVPLYGGTVTDLQFRPGTNLVSSGVVTGSPGAIFSFQGATYNKTDTYQGAIGGIYDSGPLRITADFARTESTFVGSTESIDRTVRGVQSVAFDLERPGFTIPTLNPADAGNYYFDGLYEEAQRSTGQDYQARLDVEYQLDAGPLRSIQLGVRYTDRDAHREFGNRFSGFRSRNILQSALPLEIGSVQAGNRATHDNFSTWLAPTYDSVRDNLAQLRQFVIDLGPRDNGFGTFTTGAVDPNPESRYDANEKTYAAYGQINYKFGDFADGVIGMRVVKTKVSIEGTSLIVPTDGGAAVPTPVSAERDFTDYLPNASVRFHLTDRVQLRLAATQTRTRPTFGQLNPSANLGQPGNQPNPSDPYTNARRGGGGNPDLKPLESNNYDASLEYYFAPAGFVSVAAFRRDLNGFIQNEDQRFIDPVLGPIILSRPINTGKGRIDGAEAQVSTFLDFAFLPDFLHRFGVAANYTYLDAKTGFPTSSGQLTLDRILGVSKHTYNVAVFYESPALSLRMSYNKRSQTLETRQDRGNDVYLEYGEPAARLDFSSSINFAKNTAFFFDATNLLGDPYRVTLSSARDGAPRADYVRFLRYEERTFTAGLRFRF
jgi:iron complex outermembrane recepter protein